MQYITRFLASFACLAAGLCAWRGLTEGDAGASVWAVIATLTFLCAVFEELLIRSIRGFKHRVNALGRAVTSSLSWVGRLSASSEARRSEALMNSRTASTTHTI